MHWQAHAPANIALIKYMGKKDEQGNVPDNASLSYTLNQLITTVRLEVINEPTCWQPLDLPDAIPFTLSSHGQKRFIAHLERIKAYFGYEGNFLIQSANNFPHSSGLASSASSFAALTRCAVMALSELTQKPLPSIEEQARLSQQGSGSSCRSFYSPWALWEEDQVGPIELPYQELIHQVIVISSAAKAVSSSEAHKRVKSSAEYQARSQRAERRLKLLLEALNQKDWESAYHICWQEFQDMHHLFETCSEAFTYMTDRTHDALGLLQSFWEEHDDGPLVTMDAGPNIHLLYRLDQREMADAMKTQLLAARYDVL